MKEKKKRKVSQSWKISRKTTVNININPQTVETFPLFNLQPFPDTSSPSSFPSLFTLIHLCSSLSSCFLLFHVFFPRTYTSHSTSLLTLISMPSSISFEKFHDIFVQEKKKISSVLHISDTLFHSPHCCAIGFHSLSSVLWFSSMTKWKLLSLKPLRIS